MPFPIEQEDLQLGADGPRMVKEGEKFAVKKPDDSYATVKAHFEEAAPGDGLPVAVPYVKLTPQASAPAGTFPCLWLGTDNTVYMRTPLGVFFIALES